MPDLNEQDVISLQRMCNVNELSDGVVRLAKEFQCVHHRESNGPLSTPVKQMIAVLCGFGKRTDADNIKKLEYDWEKVPEGADVRIYQGNSLNGGRGNIYSGTFISVLRGDDFGMLEIAVDGASEPSSKIDHRIVRFTPSVGMPVFDEPRLHVARKPEKTELHLEIESSESPISEPLDAMGSLGPINPVETTEDRAVDFTATNDVADPEAIQSQPVQVNNWAGVEIGTPVVVAESEGGAIRFGKLHRIPNPEGKYAGKLYVAVEGDDKKFRLYNEEEVTIAVTTKSNA